MSDTVEKSSSPVDLSKVAIFLSVAVGALHVYGAIRTPAYSDASVRAQVEQHTRDISDLRADQKALAKDMRDQLTEIATRQNQQSRDWADLKVGLSELKVAIATLRRP